MPVPSDSSPRNPLAILLLAGAVWGLVACRGARPAPAPALVSRARPVELLTPEWTCPALPETDAAAPFAVLRVLVDDRGRVAHVHVARATDRAVGEIAARCAIAQRYSPRTNPAGRPVAAVLEVTVRFERRRP